MNNWKLRDDLGHWTQKPYLWKAKFQHYLHKWNHHYPKGRASEEYSLLDSKEVEIGKMYLIIQAPMYFYTCNLQRHSNDPKIQPPHIFSLSISLNTFYLHSLKWNTSHKQDNVVLPIHACMNKSLMSSIFYYSHLKYWQKVYVTIMI